MQNRNHIVLRSLGILMTLLACFVIAMEVVNLEALMQNFFRGEAHNESGLMRF